MTIIFVKSSLTLENIFIHKNIYSQRIKKDINISWYYVENKYNLKILKNNIFSSIY